MALDRETVTDSDALGLTTLGVSARAVVERADGTILLIRRARRSTMDPGTWELPGGKVDPGEQLIDALSREVAEETGLTVLSAVPFDVSHFAFGHIWVTCVLYRCRCQETAVVALSAEHDEHMWVRPEDSSGYPLARAVGEQLDAFIELRDETRR